MQNEIWMRKPLEERLGVELLEAVNTQIEDRICSQHPAFSEGEIQAEFIRQIYKDE